MGTPPLAYSAPDVGRQLRDWGALAAEVGLAEAQVLAEEAADRAATGALYLACVGQFKRGKSTLLNALVGMEVLPSGVIPVTAVPTVLRYGAALAARARFAAAGWRPWPIAELAAIVTEAENPGNCKGVMGVEVQVPSPLLAEALCLVDTPGLGSVSRENASATRAFLPRLDAALCVTGFDPPLSGEELEMIAAVAAQVPDWALVLNKADRAEPGELAEAAAFARRTVAQRLHLPPPRVLAISALQRLRGAGPDRDWPELLAFIRDLARRSRAIAARSAQRAATRLRADILAVVAAEREALARPEAAAVRAAVTAARQRAAVADLSRELPALLGVETAPLLSRLAAERAAFLASAIPQARRQLSQAYAKHRDGGAKKGRARGQSQRPARRRLGPRYRRDLNRAAQSIAQATVTPWLATAQAAMDAEFGQAMQRIIVRANDHLQRLAASLPEARDFDSDAFAAARSHFQFHEIERIAAPASPLLWLLDLIIAAVGWSAPIERSAQDFLAELLTVNAARVEGDIAERVQAARKALERNLRQRLDRAAHLAELGISRARQSVAAGAEARAAANQGLNAIESALQITGSQCRESDVR
jgi:GTP-binding protein EngB required for normal cell division